MSDDENYPPEFELQLGKQLIIEGFLFTPERVIGRGSFGIVYLIRTPESSTPLALKLVVEDRRYKNREHQLLSEIKHPYVTALVRGFFVQATSSNDQILYIVMPYYPETVNSVYREYMRLKEHVPLSIVRLVMFEATRALLYLHSQNIIHRDIKPTNLLIDPATLRVAICDFGSAKELIPNEENVSYICSRHYRAPELILGATFYTEAIDIWSLGCILGEILWGQPLFPGETTTDELVEIIKLLGSPSSEDFFALNPAINASRFKDVKPYSVARVFRSKAHADAVDLLEKMLVYNPSKRLSSAKILAHAFFNPVRELAKQLPGGEEIPSDLFEFTDAEIQVLHQEDVYDLVIGAKEVEAIVSDIEKVTV